MPNIPAPPQIIKIEARYLAGIHQQMSLAQNQTVELWTRFVPLSKQITERKNQLFYSLQVYPSELNFADFTPMTSFDKWAAVEIEQEATLPEGIETMTLSGGTYAVFIHKGPVSTFHETAGYIYGRWLPQSDYRLADKAHFEVFGPDHNPHDPEAEEEIWIPLKSKN